MIKDLEQIRPSSIVDIIHSAEQIDVGVTVKIPVKQICTLCGYISSNKICKACTLLAGLNKGRAKITIALKEETKEDKLEKNKKIKQEKKEPQNQIKDQVEW